MAKKKSVYKTLLWTNSNYKDLDHVTAFNIYFQ